MVMYDKYKAQLQVTETQLKARELERERALKLASEARLSSLESRVHPHFLFNTINSISSLIHEDPERAEKMLSQMAELLRFSLDSSQGGLVPLHREIQIVNDYLEIEKARFNDRLRFHIDVPAELADVPVPALAVQTLVENSVKYAVSARRQGATIKVSALRMEGDVLLLQVCDDGPGFAELETPAGHGLHNLQERLSNIFGDAGQLRIASAPGHTAISLEMPLKGARSFPATACGDAGPAMTPLRAYLVDDEPLALKRLERLVAQTGRVEIVGRNIDPMAAIAELEHTPCDVLFTDIEMPDLSGFQMIGRLAAQPLVIFTTAYSQYALQAFEVHSVDYLLKPVDAQQLNRALTKLERVRGGMEPKPQLEKLLEQLASALPRKASFPTRFPSRLGIASNSWMCIASRISMPTTS